jgi:dihydropteroate synthase
MLWRIGTRTLSLDTPRVVGIVNVTPDSFSDGGLFRSLDDTRHHVDRLVVAGADIIDVGGESTRPQGAMEVDVDEELRRVIPAITAIAADHPDVPISVDTVKATVAREAMCAGASIVNDVSGFRLDADMASACAATGAGVVLMHSRGNVGDMATFDHARYSSDVTGDVIGELQVCIDRALGAGVGRDCIALDPGIGFSKRAEHSIQVLADLRRFVALDFPVLVGVSRKRFIGQITGVSVAAERVAGTIGANVASLERGARLFRVHDVKPAREALDVAWAIMQAARPTERQADRS